MMLLTSEIRAQLQANAAARYAALAKGERDPDPVPVVRVRAQANRPGEAGLSALRVSKSRALNADAFRALLFGFGSAGQCGQCRNELHERSPSM